MFKTPPTFLNHVVSPVRTFATAPVSLADVKETAKHLGVTFNDVHEATDAMMHGLVEIRQAAGLSAELTPVDTAMAPATAAG